MIKRNDSPAIVQPLLPGIDKFTIPLNNGLSTIIDAADTDLLNMKWCAKTKNRTYVLTRNSRLKPREMHRIIMQRIVGRTLLRTEFVDHIDNDPLNNTRSNLRLCSPSQNLFNQKMQSRKVVPFKGVMKRGKKFRAKIQVNHKRIELGTYNTAEEAHEAYMRAARLIAGEFARAK